MPEPPDPIPSFLTVEEAAAKLGLSRLRVREAAARGHLPCRRDNEGRLRIDLPGDVAPSDQDGALEPEAVLALLFDEVEELDATVQSARTENRRLADLVARQDAALGAADVALTDREDQLGRVSLLLERALGHLEAADDRAQRLSGTADRSLVALDTALSRAEVSEAQAARLAGVLDRAMAVAEQSHGVQPVADRAMDLLSQALAEAEAAQIKATAAETALSQNTAKLADREQALDRVLAISERATALANSQHAPRRGFWRRLFGR